MTPVPDRNTILVIDDEPTALHAMELVLRIAGFTSVATCLDSRLAMERLAQGDVAVVLLDLWMPHLPGEQLLERLTAHHPDLPVIIITGANDVATAVRCIKLGAHDFITKPVERDRLLMAVRRARELSELKNVNARLSERVLAGGRQTPEGFADLITADPAMLAVCSYIEAVAPSLQPVLITGETGTGKELVAQALHRLSGRAGELVAVNAAGLDDTMFADTLFGHRKGAFTGADSDRAGLVEKAAGGTLFLDEIGDLGPASQVKLLRLIQENEFLPLGCDSPRRSSARVVAATSRRLSARNVDKSGSDSFRADLYYRLRAHRVLLPPLRERLGDLRLLVPHFAACAARELGRHELMLDETVVELLECQNYPGNVRELRALIYDAVSLCPGDTLTPEHFRQMRSDDSSAHHILPPSADCTFGKRLPTLKEIQRLLIDEVLRRTAGNQAAAATLLGVSRQALNKRLRADDAGTAEHQLGPGQ